MNDLWTGTGEWEGWKITKSDNGQQVLLNPEGESFGPNDILRLVDVFTVPEAATVWEGVTEPTLKRYLAEGRFRWNEARKGRGTWLLTRQGMNRIFKKNSR